MATLRLSSAAVLATAAAVLLSACPSATDLGRECVLIKRDPADTNPDDGINSIVIRESEVTTGKDFISFGATECDDLVCVRDARMPLSGDPTAAAKGVCSRPCIPSNAASCDTGDRSIDEDDAARFNCRPLLLDEETLAAIREADPAKYQRYFGTTQSPDFCVGPTVTQ